WLAESLAIVKALLAGQPLPPGGSHYALTEAAISPLPVQKPRPPILVAGHGRRLLALAAREADIVALGLPPDAPAAEAAALVAWLREAAGERFGELELNVNLMAVGQRVPRYLSSQLGLTAEALAGRDALSALTGSTDAMCERLIEHRRTLGI